MSLFYRFTGIENFHIFSTRVGGISSPPFNFLNLSFTVGDDPQNVIENRKILSQKAGFPLEKLVLAQQVHHDGFHIVTEKDAGRGAFSYEDAIPETDILLTGEKNIPIGVLLADCLGMVLSSPKAVAVAHAGWRGTSLSVARKTVELMREEFGISPGEVKVAFSPAIEAHNYEVDLKRAEEFALKDPANEKFVMEADGKIFLDIVGANFAQLVEEGIKPSSIFRPPFGTSHPLFFSHRLSGGRTGRQIALAMLV